MHEIDGLVEESWVVPSEHGDCVGASYQGCRCSDGVIGGAGDEGASSFQALVTSIELASIHAIFLSHSGRWRISPILGRTKSSIHHDSLATSWGWAWCRLLTSRGWAWGLGAWSITSRGHAICSTSSRVLLSSWGLGACRLRACLVFSSTRKSVARLFLKEGSVDEQSESRED